MIPVFARCLVAAALAFASAPAAAEIPVDVRGGDRSEVQEQADGGALHRGSGLRFPKQAGAMSIGKLVVYGPNDVSAAYWASTDPADPWLSFYIYPATLPIDEEVREVAGAIEQYWIAKKIAAPIALTLPADARSGWYDVKNKDAAGNSVFVVVRRGDWYLKARVTIPHGADSATVAQVQSALAALPWAASGATTTKTSR